MYQFVVGYLLIGCTFTWLLDWYIDRREKRHGDNIKSESWELWHYGFCILVWPFLLCFMTISIIVRFFQSLLRG